MNAVRMPFWKKMFLAFTLFGLGALCGAFTLLLSEKSLARQVFAVEGGQVLDLDKIHFKSGDVLVGLIISQTEEGVLLQVKKSKMQFRYDEIERIDLNYYTRYIQQAW